MYKALILPLCLFSLNVFAETAAEPGCALGIQKLTSNTLSFYYHTENKANAPYFYVKTGMAGEMPEATLATIMAKGNNLVSVQNTKPHLYQIPEHTQKLYVVVTENSLAGSAPAAQVLPVLRDKSSLINMPSRNAGNYPQPLPEMSLQPKFVKNINNVENKLTDENKTIKICEVVL